MFGGVKKTYFMYVQNVYNIYVNKSKLNQINQYRFKLLKNPHVE